MRGGVSDRMKTANKCYYDYKGARRIERLFGLFVGLAAFLFSLAAFILLPLLGIILSWLVLVIPLIVMNRLGRRSDRYARECVECGCCPNCGEDSSLSFDSWRGYQCRSCSKRFTSSGQGAFK